MTLLFPQPCASTLGIRSAANTTSYQVNHVFTTGYRIGGLMFLIVAGWAFHYGADTA